MSLTTSRPETFPSTQSPTSFPTLVPQISLTTSLPPLSSSGETRTQPENVTSPASDSGLNSTLLPISSTQGSGMGMVLLPVGIITVLALLLVVLLYIRKKKRLDKLRHQLMPMYSFDPAEEQDDLEQELLDHGRDGSPARPNSKTLTSSHGTTQKPSRLVFSDVAEAIRA